MDFITLQINEQIINNSNKILIADGENYLYIISNDDREIRNYSIIFTISIEETYSKKCQISLTIEPCYSSCKRCSESIYNSNLDEHNCIDCKENYYPFENKKSNCYSKEEFANMHLYWYFDENENTLGICHSSCKQCYGPYENNCLSCFSNNTNIKYLYKGKCLDQCPIGTFKFEIIEGKLICEDCYKNCKTCSERGNITQMNCDSCLDNTIINNKGCYAIYNEIDKSFYNPEYELEITSCYELFGKYIKENTSICIDEIEDGYFISNPKTGLLSKFDSNCISYSLDKTYCESCQNNLYPQEGICVTTCSSHFYLYNNTCYKCHDNCLTCINGKIFDLNEKLISMECIQCKDESMIKNEQNCFPIIIYEENKIIFNVSEIDHMKENGTCLYFNKSILYNTYECIPKPDKTYYVLTNEHNTGVVKYCNPACDSCFGEGNLQDTNCLKCSEGYFKTEDSNTNCILESLIPSNYYKNETDNIYYKKKFISTNQIIVESFKKDEYEDIIKNKIELIFDFISSNSSSLVINNTEVIQVILTSDKISIEEQLRAGISPVDLGDCPEDIKEFYNISKEENLIILNQEKKNNNKKKKSSGNNNENSINLGTFSQLEIYDFSGRKLNLSVCAKSITLLKYIGDVEEININSAKNYAEKGIDIFNASSDFFNDLCFQNKIDE